MQIFQLFLLFLPSISNAQFLDIGSNRIEVPKNAEEGDLIFMEPQIRAMQNLDESVQLQVEGNPAALAVNTSIIDSDQPINFILVNKNGFENGVNRMKIQALGVVSGKVQEVELAVHKSEVYSRFPKFLDPPNLLLKNAFDSRETAIMKVSAEIPAGSQIELYGRYSQRIRASYEGDSVILETVACDDCEVEFPFDLLAIIRNGDQYTEHVITFDEEKKSTLRMSQRTYTTTIEEHTGDQENMIKVTAMGNSSEIVYTLRDSTGLFSIHPKEGLLSIMHPEFLTIQSFGEIIEMLASATDGETTVNSKINLKISPKIFKNVMFGFDKEIYDISSTTNQKIVGNIRAKSPNKLVYRITEGRDDLYEIDSDGNIIYIGDIIRDDRNDLISVTVHEANGGLKMSSTYVKVDLKGIGSFPITVNSAELEGIESVSANDEESVVVTSVQFEDDDKDADLEFGLKSVYKLEKEDPLEYFAVKSGDDKKAHLTISKSLATSNLTSVRLEIVGIDRSHPNEPSISVYRTILIEREKSLEIPKMLNLLPIPEIVNIPIDAPVGSYVYQAIVLPAIQDAKFNVEPEHIFAISENGTITTRKSIREESAKMPFRVTVTSGDVKKTTESTLHVEKVQRVAEHFSELEYTNTLPRVAPIGTVVAIVSTTTGTNDGFLLRGGHAQFFSVDDEGTIKTREDFGSSVLSDFDFIVALKKRPEINAPVHVHLEDIRNNTIILVENQIFASVYDNLPKNSFVARVDGRGEKLDYKLTSDDVKIAELFDIEEDGTIRNNNFLTDLIGMHTLSVQVSSIDQSGVRSTNATIVIDVLKSNECVPKFKENMIFYARESSPIDTLIGKIEAIEMERKCALEYEELKGEGEQDGPISVDSMNGEIRTRKEFDFEKAKSYMVTLRLTAGRNNQVTQMAEIRIIDDNDHKVHFDQNHYTVEILENVAPSVVIFTAKAIDKDVGEKIYYHLAPSSPPQFSLHSISGEVSVEQTLDYEKEKEYTIKIGASNTEKSKQENWQSEMILTVKVKDVNDNGPSFTRDHFNAVADKNKVVGSSLINIQATDPDASDFGKKLEYSVTSQTFEYRGMSRNVDDVFDVHQFDGDVYTLKSLRDYVGGVFHLAIQARDVFDGTTGKTNLKIYVNDESDLLNVELPYKPTEVNSQVVDDLLNQLSNSTNLIGLANRITYKSAHGITSTSSVDLQMIFFNKTSTEIVPAEKVLAIVENVRGLPEIRKHQQLLSSEPQKLPVPMIQPELLLIGVIFFVLLAITLVLCGLLMCYYRNKFQKQKRIVENDRAIKNSINFPTTRSPALISFKHYPSPAPEMSRPIPNGDQYVYIKSPSLNENVASYAVQQATITVAENEEKI